MSENFYDEMEGLIKRHRESDAAAAKAAAEDERFAQLNARFDALEERLPARQAPSPNPSPATGDGPPEGQVPTPVPPPTPEPAPEPEPELPVQRVTRLAVPRVYTGDDEPERVEYIDEETGETKTRPGRRKNQATIWDVTDVDSPAQEVPQE